MRKGYGKGKGQGYKNLMPMDSYVHSMSAQGVKTIEIDRASYGKLNPKLAKDLREYRLKGTMFPVGTIKEWKKFAKESGIKKIQVTDIDGDFDVTLDAKGLTKKQDIDLKRFIDNLSPEDRRGIWDLSSKEVIEYLDLVYTPEGWKRREYHPRLDAKTVKQLSKDDFKELKEKFGDTADNIIANQIRYRSKITEHPFFKDKNIEEINESSAGGGYYKVYMVTVTNPRTKFGDDLYIVKVVEKWGEPRITAMGKVKDRVKGWTNIVGEGLDKRNLKFVNLDAKRVRELGKTTRLEVEQAITVPSTEFDKPISPAKFQKRVDEVQTYLAKTFGGETTVTGQGGYVAESGKLIPEKVKVVTSFADDKDFEQNVAKVYQKIKDWKKQWKQETVAYMVENDLYLI